MKKSQITKLRIQERKLSKKLPIIWHGRLKKRATIETLRMMIKRERRELKEIRKINTKR